MRRRHTKGQYTGLRRTGRQVCRGEGRRKGLSEGSVGVTQPSGSRYKGPGRHGGDTVYKSIPHYPRDLSVPAQRSPAASRITCHPRPYTP